LGIPNESGLNKLFYCQCKFTSDGLITYDVTLRYVTLILIDVDVSQIISWKSQFPFNPIIEPYVTSRIPTNKIMMLLYLPITSSFTNLNRITSIEPIVYLVALSNVLSSWKFLMIIILITNIVTLE